MAKIKNSVEISTYDDTKPEKISIKSHWNRRDFVEIQIGKEKVVVVASDLKKAIDNCVNV